MVLMAGAGRIDYTKADSNSLGWLTRENLMLADYERELLAADADKRHMQHTLSASGWSIWAEDGKLQDQVVESQKYLRKSEQLAFPWLKLDEHSYYGNFVSRLRDEFARKFGDPDDPETKKKIKQSRDQIKRRELEAQQRQAMEKRELSTRREKLRQRRERFRSKRHGKPV
jgi:hypothetical protein